MRDTPTGAAAPPSPRRPPLRTALALLSFAVLVYNGLIWSVALCAELLSPFLVEESGRITVQNAYFVKDPALGWRMMPDLSVLLQGPGGAPLPPYCTTDDRGLRPSPHRHGRDTVVLLGDSFVQGYYLFDHETIGTRLGHRADVNVVNAGVGGFSTDQEYILLTQILEKESPSWVVVLFFVNDLLYLGEGEAWGMKKPYFEQVNGTLDFSAARYDVTRSEMEELLAAQGQTGLEVKGCCIPDVVDRVMSRARKSYDAFPRPAATIAELRRQVASMGLSSAAYAYQIPDPAFYRAAPELHATKWDLLFQFLTRIEELGRRRDFRLLVVYVPELAQTADPEQEHFEPQDRFLDGCGAHQLECIDPHLRFAERQRQEDLYFMDEGHLSPAGADLMAQVIGAHLSSAANPEP